MSIYLINPFVYKKTLSFLGSSQSTAGTAAYTFAAATLGTPQSDRRIIVGIAGANSTRTLSSVTIAGVTATVNIAFTASGDNNTVGIATAFVPNGLTGDIVVTWSGTQPVTNIGWYRATGLPDNNAYATITDPLPGTSSALSIGSIPGGIFIGLAGESGVGDTLTATNTTKDYTFTGNRESDGISALTPDSTFSFTITQSYSNTNRAFVGATF